MLKSSRRKSESAALHQKQLEAQHDECDLRMRADLRLAESRDKKGQPTFEILAYSGGSFTPDKPRLDAPMVLDLSSVTSKKRIAAILDHDDTQIVGQTTSVTISEDRVEMTGVVTGDWRRPGEPAETVMTHAKGGFVWPVSLGASIGGLDFIESGDSEEINGNDVNGPVYVARRVQIRHITFLSDGADQSAEARVAAKAARRIGANGDEDEKENAMKFSAWLKALGFVEESALSEEQLSGLKAKWKKEAEPPVEPPADPPKQDDPAPKKLKARSSEPDARLAELRLRRARNQKIKDLAVQYADDYPDSIDVAEELCASAIEDEGLSVADFENLLLRECTRSLRMSNTVRPSASRRDIIGNAEFEAALCRRGGMPATSIERQFKPDTLEVSERRWKNGISPRQFIDFAARAHGYSGATRDDLGDILVAAFPRRDMLHAASGPSTYDVSGILGNVMNRFVVDYFNAVDLAAMNMIAARRPVADFRQISSYSLTGDLTFEKVEPGGEIRHGTFGESGYTNQADTYGKLVAIDRRDLINDDLGALSRIGQRLGRGGALALTDVFWTAFINNGAFFTTARGNLDEGADTALSIDALTLAKTLFNKQTDPDGKPISVAPHIMLVPPELEATTKVILNSQIVVMAGTEDPSVVRGNANIHSGTLDLAMARELSNASYTGHSALKWYVLAPPGVLPTIELCFLNGRDTPVVENAQADFDTLGIKVRGYFDFGVAMQEYRGGVAMKGEV